jgi:hypothetical protein
VEELWTSEKVYVEKLGIIVELVMKPLLRSATSKTAKLIITADEVRVIFANIEAILAHHRKFLVNLSIRVRSSPFPLLHRYNSVHFRDVRV